MTYDQPPPARTLPIQNPGPAPTVSTEPDYKDLSRRLGSPAPTQRPTDHSNTTKQPTTATKPVPTTMKPTTETTTPKPTTTKLTTTSRQTTTLRTTIQPTTPITQHSTSASDTSIDPPIEVSATAESRLGPKRRLSWTESPADQPKTTKKPGRDTYSAVVYKLVSAHIFGFL